MENFIEIEIVEREILSLLNKINVYEVSRRTNSVGMKVDLYSK